MHMVYNSNNNIASSIHSYRVFTGMASILPKPHISSAMILKLFNSFLITLEILMEKTHTQNLAVDLKFLE